MALMALAALAMAVALFLAPLLARHLRMDRGT
jgi:hypothetical protein